jgi:hypothetical protein
MDISANANADVGRFMVEAGYATIKGSYKTSILLDYPNEEIRDFIKSDYMKVILGTSTESNEFTMAKQGLLYGNGNVTVLIRFLNDCLLPLSYHHANMFEKESAWVVLIYQTLLCMDAEFNVEMPNFKGRSDVLLFIGDTQYVLELKVANANGNAKILKKAALEALKQINDKQYWENSFARKRCDTISKTIKIGLVADTHPSVRRFALMISQPHAANCEMKKSTTFLF